MRATLVRFEPPSSPVVENSASTTDGRVNGISMGDVAWTKHMVLTSICGMPLSPKSFWQLCEQLHAGQAGSSARIGARCRWNLLVVGITCLRVFSIEREGGGVDGEAG